MDGAAAEIALHAAPRDVLDHEALQPGRVEESAVTEAAGLGRDVATHDDLQRPYGVAGPEADHLLDAQGTPGRHESLSLSRRLVGGGREERGVDRPDAGAGDDIDRDLMPEAPRQILPEVLDDPGFVGST